MFFEHPRGRPCGGERVVTGLAGDGSQSRLNRSDLRSDFQVASFVPERLVVPQAFRP